MAEIGDKSGSKDRKDVAAKNKFGEVYISVQCINTEEKKNIMMNKKKLGEKEVYIENDLTWKERQIREKTWTKFKEIRGEGKKAMITGLRKIRAEEGTWTWSEWKGKWFLDKEHKLQERTETDAI